MKNLFNTIEIKIRDAKGAIKTFRHAYATAEEARAAAQRIFDWIKTHQYSAAVCLQGETCWTKIKFHAGRCLAKAKGLLQRVGSALKQGINWFLGLFQSQKDRQLEEQMVMIDQYMKQKTAETCAQIKEFKVDLNLDSYFQKMYDEAKAAGDEALSRYYARNRKA